MALPPCPFPPSAPAPPPPPPPAHVLAPACPPRYPHPLAGLFVLSEPPLAAVLGPRKGSLPLSLLPPPPDPPGPPD